MTQPLRWFPLELEGLRDSYVPLPSIAEEDGCLRFSREQVELDLPPTPFHTARILFEVADHVFFVF